MIYLAYCVRCHRKVEVKDSEMVEIKTKKGIKNAVKGICPDCGTKVNVFIKKE